MSRTPTHRPAPTWDVSQWFNSDGLDLAGLRGKVVVLEAFQMLCPGCVAHALPQAKRVESAFAGADVQVVGLHSVFEHHAAMTPIALEAFLSEYGLTFPVGVDRHAEDGTTPLTFARYGMQGTPTTVLIDREGRLRMQRFGSVDDLMLGASIATLLAERSESAHGSLHGATRTPESVHTHETAPAHEGGVCTVGGECT
ncbi:peroxiredoxin family protein [Streptomyces griseoaurantiacus]|uniref:peroxiredoxin family protein n=1 Tax=Streptomyces griseoaurantiacus TaxID=68213 RepID=UPI0036AF18B8